MTQQNLNLFQPLLSATFCGALVVGSLSQPVEASSRPTGLSDRIPNPSLISLQFQAPGEAAPASSMGGGTRGVRFSAPGDGAPQSSMGGGTRGEVKFAAPGDGAPTNSMGGGTRGATRFSAPGDAAPTNSLGGGTRGEAQFSAPGDAAPQSSVGGGTRGDVNFSAPGDAAPASTVSGGTRTDGLPAAMTALLPTTRYGRTVAARPTFFVYMPSSSAREVFFSIQDEAGNHLYQTLLRISGTGGIISVTLPENAPELEIGKNYVWFFAPISPGEILRPDTVSVVGWVKRVEATTVAGATALDRATEYAKSGIWYDTVTVLASAQQTQPGNVTLASEWKDLLKQVGLEAIATQPLTERL